MKKLSLLAFVAVLVLSMLACSLGSNTGSQQPNNNGQSVNDQVATIVAETLVPARSTQAPVAPEQTTKNQVLSATSTNTPGSGSEIIAPSTMAAATLYPNMVTAVPEESALPDQSTTSPYSNLPSWGNNYTLGVSKLSTYSQVENGMQEYSISLWVETNIQQDTVMSVYDQIRAGVGEKGQQLDKNNDHYILTDSGTAWGYTEMFEGPLDNLCDNVFLMPGIPLSGFTGMSCMLNFDFDFTIPYQQHPTLLHTPIGDVQIPALNGQEFTGTPPAFTGTKPFGTETKQDNLRFTVQAPVKLRDEPADLDPTVTRHVYQLEVKTESADPNLDLSFDVSPQLVDSDGVLLLQSMDCTSQYDPQAIDAANGKLVFNHTGEQTEIFCFRSISLNPNPSFAFSLILNNVPYTFSGN